MAVVALMVEMLEAAMVLSGSAAQPAIQPTVHVSDSWHYKNTVEKQGHFTESHDESTVVRTQSDAILLRIHMVDSPLQPTEVLVGNDWSRRRSVDGQELVVNRPFAFPLVAGKTWALDYRETSPNRNLSSERWEINYKVVDAEQVTVPAGTFNAVKIEAFGRWTGTLANAVTGIATTRSDEQGIAVTSRLDHQAPRGATGRLYKAFWYVPEVKRAVKVVEETYDSNGLRTESRTSELESYRVAQ